MASVLIVDDEPNIRRMIGALLSAEGYEVREAADSANAMAAAQAAIPDVALLDLMMPASADGLATLAALRERDAELPVIMMSGRAGLTDAVKATKLGAFNFLEKPLTPEGLLLALSAALELRQAKLAARALREELGQRDELVGRSAVMQQVAALIARVAPTDARVLISGESGTGKELVASAIHAASTRRDRPFIRVNCAAIPRDLVESEMFGHERGAFTGATERRIGRFELAHTGTLLLDEVGDLGAEAQAKLLRAIETQEIERVGGAKPIRADVRILAATNKDLTRAVADGSFREDLYFRLNVIPLAVPALRAHADDIPLLVHHFGLQHRSRTGRVPNRWSAEALAMLARYSWPGNVRELGNIVERLAILHPGEEITPDHLRSVLGPSISSQPPHPPTPSPQAGRGRDFFDAGRAAGTRPLQGHDTAFSAATMAMEEKSDETLSLTDSLDGYEKTLITNALAAANGSVSEAARKLQTDRPNLYRRMKRLGITGLVVIMCALVPHIVYASPARCLGGGEGRVRETVPSSIEPPKYLVAPFPRPAPTTTNYKSPSPPRIIARNMSADNAVSLALVEAGRGNGRRCLAPVSAPRPSLQLPSPPIQITHHSSINPTQPSLNPPPDPLPRTGAGDEFIVSSEGREGAAPTTARHRVADTIPIDTTHADTVVTAKDTTPPSITPDSTTEKWWQRWLARNRKGSWVGLSVNSAHTYNRVEGLPIEIGPSAQGALPWGTLTADAYGIVRTGQWPQWSQQDIGYGLKSELHFGHGLGWSIGGRLYDEDAPVESWQLSDAEIGLASFLFHHDYADYYNRHGGQGYVRYDASRDVSLTASYAVENWNSPVALDPFTVLLEGAGWRANPQLDNGVYRTASVRFQFDSRNTSDDPAAGWYGFAQIDRGLGTITSLGPRTEAPLPPITIADVGGPNIEYWRGFFDARRYNRIDPLTHLNLRLVLGGWMGGDPLPLEARYSLGGAGTLPGFAFRNDGAAGDPRLANVATCGQAGQELPGDPALCDRVALAQVELRRNVPVELPHWARGFPTNWSWVIFSDAGRGWLVGGQTPSVSGLRYPAAWFPPLKTFMADAGAGLVIEPVGVYLAEPISRPDQPPRLVVRVQQRF